MRKAKNNRRVPKRYFRPKVTQCPQCGTALLRLYTLWDKIIVTLEGRIHVFSQAYHCPGPTCSRHPIIYRSEAADRVAPKGSSFSFDLIIHIGWWRFWEHQTLDEIHARLRDRHLPISRRHILNLMLDFLALVYATQPQRLATFRRDWERHGLYVSVDGLQPETGNDCLYVVRELTHDLTLWAVIVSNRSAENLRTQVVEPILSLGFRLRGVVSDAEEGVRDAFALSCPGIPHQACHTHCLREAAKPIFERDRALKTDLKRDFRPHLRQVRRQISALSPHHPFRPILSDYADILRLTLRQGGCPPFDLGGLQVFEDLQMLARSLRRCRKKGDILFWMRSFRLRRSAALMPENIMRSHVNALGWLNWRDSWIQNALGVIIGLPARSSAA